MTRSAPTDSPRPPTSCSRSRRPGVGPGTGSRRTRSTQAGSRPGCSAMSADRVHRARARALPRRRSRAEDARAGCRDLGPTGHLATARGDRRTLLRGLQPTPDDPPQRQAGLGGVAFYALEIQRRTALGRLTRADRVRTAGRRLAPVKMECVAVEELDARWIDARRCGQCPRRRAGRAAALGQPPGAHASATCACSSPSTGSSWCSTCGRPRGRVRGPGADDERAGGAHRAPVAVSRIGRQHRPRRRDGRAVLAGAG